MEKENMFFSNDEFLNNQNWDNSMDQTDPFESALSSMVSSPTTSNCNNNNKQNDNFVLRELIGRLGGICNNNNNSAGEISPQILNINTTSNYSTPLNSPPKLNLGVIESSSSLSSGVFGMNSFVPNLVPFATDPGFVERAARFSCFANKSGISGLNSQLGLSEMGKISRVSSSQSIKVPQENRGGAGAFLEERNEKMSEFVDCKDVSSISEQIPGGEIGLNLQNDANNNSTRKRKSVQRGKAKESPASAPAKDTNVVSENCEANAKRSKSGDGSGSEKNGAKDGNEKESKENSKAAAEPPKDYIHVRARRGQATDAHSLAERVRREKIGERMKLLQDLVPGCNKVTGKAVMLDEIINYVQSLQRQVEFLSMKLATVNPRMDINMEALVSKDMFQSSRGSLSHNSYPSSDCYPFQSQPNLHTAMTNGTEASFINAALARNQGMQLPPMDNYSETASQASTFWENDLHNVVQMGYGQNQTQNFHGILPTSQMKAEL